MPEDYKDVLDAYSLRGYPFGLAALNPLVGSDDDKLRASVDGWRRATELSDFMQKRIDEQSGAVIVVAGGSGTGRTSLTNYAIEIWRSLLGVDHKRLVVVNHLAVTADGASQTWQWSNKVRNRILKARLTLDQDVQDELKQLQREMPGTPTTIGDALLLVVNNLQEQDANVVGVIEKVSDPVFLSHAKDIAEAAGILIILTVDHSATTDEKVVQQADVLEGVGKVLTLGHLTGPEVAEMVIKRWRCYSDDPCPFTEYGLAAAFAEPQRPLKGALTLLDIILQAKQVDFAQSLPWPRGTQLAIEDNELMRKVKIHDSAWRA